MGDQVRKLAAGAAVAGAVLVGAVWMDAAQAAPPGPQYVSVSVVTVAGPVSLVAQCPTGTKVLGGGHEMTFLPDASGSISASTDGVEDSYPDATVNGWRLTFENTNSPYASGIRLTAHAVCG